MIAGPGFKFPVYRRNGKSYTYVRNISDDELLHARTGNVEEASRNYREGAKSQELPI